MRVCPTCHRAFIDEGFCPFDGSALTEKEVETVNRFPSDSQSTDNMATRPHRGTGTLAGSAVPSGSAVANVLKSVLEERKTGSGASLIGVELDGRYRIEKLIGEGGMGMVYLARHIVIEKPVAIKVLRAEVAADDSVAKRFVQEARAASRIGHPNIVDVTDFGTTKAGLTYQVMEFLEGQTLTDLIRTVQPLPLSRALGVIAQMARALGAAHDKGIVHRDLKPDNIFLVRRDGREDFVKIVDFGIAKMPPRADDDDARLTQVGTVFGTPEYMSPEQAAGRTDVDSRADIYAVGTILYEMLVGRVPHKGETTVRTLAMQILDDPPPPREARPDLEITADLENVVMRALAKNRDERFQTMQEMLDAMVEVTSKTELDLPLLLKQERHSANLGSQDQFDTVPEVDVEGLESSLADSTSTGSITSVRDVERAARATGGTRSRRTSRVTDPAFLRRGSSASVPIFDPIEPEETGTVATSKNHFGLVALALLLVGGGVGAFVLVRGGGEKTPVAATTLDAAVAPLVQTPTDARAEFDAGPVDAIDADARPIATTARNTTTRPRNTQETPDPVGIQRPNISGHTPALHGDLEVTIITRPRGGRLVIDNAYAGSDGLNLRRKAGTTLTVECRLQGYRDGKVEVTFDNSSSAFVCKLKEIRTKRCVDGMKNPFDNCP